jgi:riboflavin transporter FmnP
MLLNFEYFIPVFAKTCHWTMSGATSIQFIHVFKKIHFSIIFIIFTSMFQMIESRKLQYNLRHVLLPIIEVRRVLISNERHHFEVR